MYCTKCGAPLNEDAKFCTECGAAMETEEKVEEAVEEKVEEAVEEVAEDAAQAEVKEETEEVAKSEEAQAQESPVQEQQVDAPQTPPQPAYTQTPPQGSVNVNTTPFLVWSIINLVLCCFPIGIVGLVFTLNAGKATDQAAADEALKKAKTFNLIGTITGAVIFLVYILIIAGSVLSMGY